MARVVANVVVRDPSSGAITVLVAGDAVPSWAADQVGAHLLASSESAASDVPPQRGPGSGRDAWAAYAGSEGVDVGGDASRDEIVAALEAAGVPVE